MLLSPKVVTEVHRHLEAELLLLARYRKLAL
jgi:hypothetical protein